MACSVSSSIEAAEQLAAMSLFSLRHNWSTAFKILSKKASQRIAQAHHVICFENPIASGPENALSSIDVTS
jgi:hypothetical protein